MHTKTNSIKFIYGILLIMSLFNCTHYKFILTNENSQTESKSKEIEGCFEQSSVIKNSSSLEKYILLNGKKSSIFIVKNEKDNRYYLGVKKNKFILPIEITCENLDFRFYRNIDDLQKDTIGNHVSIIFNDSVKGRPLKIGVNQFLINNHFGNICEFNSNGDLKYCINKKRVFEVDSLGNVKETFLY